MKPVKTPKTKDLTLALFDANPEWTSYQLADALGVMPEYIRATLKRNGRRLARSPARLGMLS